MHKKTTDRLKQLASAILESKSDNDIKVFKEVAREIYEELCVLEFLNTQEKVSEETQKPLDKTEDKSKDKADGKESQEALLFSIEEEIGTTENLEDIFIKKNTEESNSKPENTSYDPHTTLKEKIEAAKQAASQKPHRDLTHQTKPQASLNDKLFKSALKIDLNDRIAFVKHLFGGSQEDFNRVLSQLNTFESERASKNFILNQVKPDYSWEGKEDYEERLLMLIERKFM